MSTSSPNFQFILPDGDINTGDDVDIDELNDNFTKLDTVLESIRNPPRAKMSITANQTILAAAVNNPSNNVVKGRFNFTDYFNRITADQANNQFVIVEAGLYAISCMTSFENAINGGERKTFLMINDVTTGNARAQCYDGASFGNAASCFWYAERNLSPGDVVAMGWWHNDAGPVDASINTMTIRRVAFDGLGD